MNRKIKYLTTFTDSAGINHTSIHSYDRLTGFVDMMKDFKLEGFKYPCTDIVAEQYQKEHEKWLESNKRFKVIKTSSSDKLYKVWDTEKDNGIATFYNKDEAEDYAEYKNGNSKYL